LGRQAPGEIGGVERKYVYGRKGKGVGLVKAAGSEGKTVKKQIGAQGSLRDQAIG